AEDVIGSMIMTRAQAYDLTVAATLTASNFSLSSLVGSDAFTVTKASGTYNSANVAAATTVSTSLIAGDLTAGATTTASNYSLPKIGRASCRERGKIRTGAIVTE